MKLNIQSYYVVNIKGKDTIMKLTEKKKKGIYAWWKCSRYRTDDTDTDTDKVNVWVRRKNFKIKLGDNELEMRNDFPEYFI